MRLYTTEQLEIISNKLTNGILPDRILGEWFNRRML